MAQLNGWSVLTRVERAVPAQSTARQRADLLRQMLRAHRRRIEPEAVGLAPRPSGRPGPRTQGLLQADLDLLTHRARGTFGRFESGRLQNITEEYVRLVAHALQISEAEYAQMYLLVFGHQPLRALDRHADMAVSEVWQRVVESTNEMAYVSNAQWDIVAYNQAFLDLFPSRRVPKNMLRWMLLDPEGRDYCLLEWDRHWAPAFVAQLRSMYIQHPGNAVIAGLHEDVFRDRRTAPHYARWTESVAEPEAQMKPFRHARLGTGLASLAVAHPVSALDAQYVVGLFDPDHPCPDVRARHDDARW